MELLLRLLYHDRPRFLQRHDHAQPAAAVRGVAGARELHYEETTWKARPDWARDGKRIVYCSGVRGTTSACDVFMKSADGTGAEAARAGARVVAAPPPAPGTAGKATACAHGAAVAAAGRWLAFVDADVVLAPGALSRLLGACLATGAAAGSPLARQVAGTWWEELVLPELGLAVAERLDLDAVADPARPDAFLSGQCLLVRRDAYVAVGGFAAVAGSLVEDVALARRLKAAGHRLEVRLAPDLAAVRMYGRFGDLWEGLAKNLAEVWGADPGSLLDRR